MMEPSSLRLCWLCFFKKRRPRAATRARSCAGRPPRPAMKHHVIPHAWHQASHSNNELGMDTMQ
eukprot:15430369-Alexandrium_andersonii.AAC.1